MSENTVLLLIFFPPLLKTIKTWLFVGCRETGVGPRVNRGARIKQTTLDVPPPNSALIFEFPFWKLQYVQQLHLLNNNHDTPHFKVMTDQQTRVNLLLCHESGGTHTVSWMPPPPTLPSSVVVSISYVRKWRLWLYMQRKSQDLNRECFHSTLLLPTHSSEFLIVL